MNEDGAGVSKCEEKDVHRLEMRYNDPSRFQFAEVDRTMPTRPVTLRSMWIGHFTFFDLCYDIWREDGGAFGGMQTVSTM